MNQVIESLIRHTVPELTRDRALSFVKFNTPGSPLRAYPKLLLFCFEAGAMYPSFCIKTVRSARDNLSIDHGYQKLKEINTLTEPGPATITFPRALACVRIDGIAYSIETAVKGRRASMSEAHRVLSAYIAFQHSLSRLQETSDKFQYGTNLINAVDLKKDVRAELHKHWASIAHSSQYDTVTLMPQHGDFTIDNILVSEHAVTLVDADRYASRGLCGYDLFHFLARDTGLGLKCTEYMRSYMRMFRNDGGFDISDVFLWYLTNWAEKQKDGAADASEIPVSVEHFNTCAATLCLS